MGKESSPAAALRALAERPQEASALAGAIVAGSHSKDVLQAALKVLVEYPNLDARPALVALYTHAGRDKGKHDQGGYLRSAILRALRPVTRSADVSLLIQACETYEYWPPDFAEDGVLIRAAGLIALADLDEDAARYQAARIVVDPLAARMTGEPATTAARVLGALGDLLPLYMIVCQHAPAADGASTGIPEVTAECLRQLTTIPAAVVERLLERYATTASSIVRMGIFDLLLNHREGPLGQAYLTSFLNATADADIYRYLVMSIVVAGHDEPLDELRRSAYRERRRIKQEILLEAASILVHRPEFAELIDHLHRQLRER